MLYHQQGRWDRHHCQACGERPDFCQGRGRHPDHHHAEERTEGESHQGFFCLTSAIGMTLMWQSGKVAKWQKQSQNSLELNVAMWQCGKVARAEQSQNSLELNVAKWQSGKVARAEQNSFDLNVAKWQSGKVAKWQEQSRAKTRLTLMWQSGKVAKWQKNPQPLVVEIADAERLTSLCVQSASGP